MKRPNIAGAAPFLRRPEDPSGLPVLTDVLVRSADAHGRTLWLAWDERRVPVLSDEVARGDDPGLPRWARRRI